MTCVNNTQTFSRIVRRVTHSIAAATLPVGLLMSGAAHAVTGDMGTGVPNFGLFSGAAGAYVSVTGWVSSTQAFPTGCTSLKLTQATMGADSYKMAVAMLMTSKLTGRAVKFRATADRDGGCGVDYVEPQN